MKQEYFSVNIGRQFGSGGRLVGEKLAKKLNFSFFDKELINIVSQESGFGKEFFEQADEKVSHGLFGGMLGLRQNPMWGEMMNNYMSNEMLFKIQSDVIRDLAEKQSCIFVGRCADYILRENPRNTNLFITADFADRIERVAERQQELDREKLPDMLQKIDKKRAGYYKYYTNKMWGMAGSYHLCINSSVLGIDGTVDYIVGFLEKRFGKKLAL